MLARPPIEFDSSPALYLPDTNVVFELRRHRPHGAVLAWLQSVSGRAVYLCGFTIGELQRGAEITRRHDPAKAAALDRWIDGVPDRFQVLAMDAMIFRARARLIVGRPTQLQQDAMIAATAAVHGMIIATRNIRDFAALGVNPFEWRG